MTMNYQRANELLIGRCKESRKLGNNTYLRRREDGNIAIQLHGTDIVTFHPDGRTTVNSGGWKTRTTFDRLNDHVEGMRFYTRNRISYVRVGGVDYLWDTNSFVVNKNGAPDLPIFDPKRERETKALLRRARKYAKQYVSAFKRGKVPPPSAGDCWSCALVSDNGKTPLGGASHIVSHMDESYYVPSLLVRAVESFPVSRVGHMAIATQWQSPQTEDEKTAQGIMSTIHGNNSFLDIGHDQIEKAIYRYCVRELGYSG